MAQNGQIELEASAVNMMLIERIIWKLGFIYSNEKKVSCAILAIIKIIMFIYYLFSSSWRRGAKLSNQNNANLKICDFCNVQSLMSSVQLLILARLQIVCTFSFVS